MKLIEKDDFPQSCQLRRRISKSFFFFFRIKNVCQRRYNLHITQHKLAFPVPLLCLPPHTQIHHTTQWPPLDHSQCLIPSMFVIAESTVFTFQMFKPPQSTFQVITLSGCNYNNSIRSVITQTKNDSQMRYSNILKRQTLSNTDWPTKMPHITSGIFRPGPALCMCRCAVPSTARQTSSTALTLHLPAL